MHAAWAALLDFSFDDINFWTESLVMLAVLAYIVKKCCIHTLPYRHITDFPAHYQEMTIEALVTRVSGGDGFEFDHVPFFSLGRDPKPSRLRARLAGIDAPEHGADPAQRQPMSAESLCYLSVLVLNRLVTLRLLGMDRHCRFLVVAYAGGINVNLEMLRAGYASLHRDGGARYDESYHVLNNAELFAKKRQNGIWGLDRLVLPPEFRRRTAHAV